MGVRVLDRVKDTTTTTGTGSVTLGGGSGAFLSITSANGFAVNDTFNYAIADQSGTNWEVGVGTITSLSPTVIARATWPYSSANITTGTITNTTGSAAGPTLNQSSAQSYILPITVTSAAHGLKPGQYVNITGVLGNTAANGEFQIASVTTNTFTLANSNGSGPYISGGSWVAYSAVSFTAGTKDVLISVPGQVIVEEDAPTFFTTPVTYLTNTLTSTVTSPATIGVSTVGISTQTWFVSGFGYGAVDLFGAITDLSYLATTSKTFNQIVTNRSDRLFYGSQLGVASSGSVIVHQKLISIGNCGSCYSEWATDQNAQFNVVGDNVSSPPLQQGRAWGSDWSMNSGVAAQPNAFSGLHYVVNNMYGGPPMCGDQFGGCWFGTQQRVGAANTYYSMNAVNYMVGTGYGILGFAANGLNTAGWQRGFQIGGSGSNWGFLRSHVQLGMEISDYSCSGIYIHRKFSGITTIQLTTKVTAATIGAGGSGYGATQTFNATVSGGTFNTAAVVNVTSNAGGVVTTVNSITTAGSYIAQPASPAATTGGTGTGLTLNLTWANNSGAGYTSQPAVTISTPAGSGISQPITATAVATLTATTVNTVTPSGGAGYTMSTALTFNNPFPVGTAATAVPATVKAAAILPVIIAGGSGYGNAQTFNATIVGGTGTAMVVNVTSNAAGVVTTVNSVTTWGIYSVVPTWPAATTGGTGFGLTITCPLTIGATGSGYGNAQTFNATLTGGTFSTASVYSVTSNSAGNVVTINSLGTAGSYTVLPSSPTSTSGGTGTLFTLNTTNAFTLNTVTVSGAGTGYTQNPTITDNALSPGGATYTIALTGTTLSGFYVTDPGNGYVSQPTATLTGGGFSTAALAFARCNLGDQVMGALVYGAGTLYSGNVPPAVTFTNAGGDTTGGGAAATAQVNESGQIVGLYITNPGAGYTAPPVITIAAPSAVTATGTVNVSLLTSTVSAGGSGYAVGDVLQYSGGTFQQPAQVQVATLSGSAVATVTVLANPNAGCYSALPSSPAATTAVTGSGSGATFTSTWGVLSCTMTNQGGWYTSPPVITFSSGAAQAVANMNPGGAGMVDGFASVTTPGSYTTIPTITFSAPVGGGSTAGATALMTQPYALMIDADAGPVIIGTNFFGVPPGWGMLFVNPPAPATTRAAAFLGEVVIGGGVTISTGESALTLNAVVTGGGGLADFQSSSVSKFRVAADGLLTGEAFKYARVTANVTQNTTTQIAATGLAFSIAANEVWCFECHLSLTQSGTKAITLGVTGPASPGSLSLEMIGNTSAIGTLTAAVPLTSFTTFATSLITAAFTGYATIVGCVVNGTNAGTVQITFGNTTTTSGTTSTVNANSFIVAWRIA